MLDLNSKCFKNKYCQDCINKNIEKYGTFKINCNGITVDQDVAFAIKNGIDEHDARWMYDARYFFEKTYGSKPRWYQEPILLCTSKNLVSRQCRQSGKTLAIAMKLMHFVVTNDGKTVLVVAPNEKVVKKIYDEYIWRDCLGKSEELKTSVKSRTQKPYYQVEFCNNSKIMLMIANESARGQTNDWLYVDEAALIPKEMLNSIIMTSASKGDDAVLIETSTPRGRGDMFFQACKEDPVFNEYHVPISIIDEMKAMVNRFKKLLGETGFIQECEAEFPDISGGPFNFKGIDLSKSDYDYENCAPQQGIIYIGGVDWNGPSIGTYFYVIGFNPTDYSIIIVDKRVVSSANWNSLIAKQTLLDLNRKWNCKHWMTDYGYSHSIIEELKAYSMKIAAQSGTSHPDSQIKNILEAIEFGSLMDVTDPFTKEETKKTTKSFIISQVSRLFEPQNNAVAIRISKNDEELVKSLENYKLLSISSRGYEQYGFEKGDGIEDHCIDALSLAIFGVVKYYSELFKRIIYSSVTLGVTNAILNTVSKPEVIDARGRNILLISNSDDTPIHLDGSKIKNPEEQMETFISRTFGKSGIKHRGDYTTENMRQRSGIIKRSMI
jgi:hypothetical protein